MTTAVQVQYRRGTSSQVTSFTGAQGEMIVDTTNNRVVVQDGSTAGGWPAAKLNDGAVAFTGGTINGTTVGGTTPEAGYFTTLSASSTVSGTGFSSYLASPPAIGGTTAAAGKFTTLQATSTLTGADGGTWGSGGINGSIIGGTTAAAGKFTTLQATSTLTGADGGTWGSGGINGSIIGGITPEAASVTAPSAGDSSSRAITSAWYGQNMPGGYLNKFRNGTMDVWQRGASSLAVGATTVFAYTADGWEVAGTYSAGSGPVVSQAGGRLLTKNSLQVTGASNVTDVKIKQRIESLIAAAFCSQTVTVQAQVYNNTGGTTTPTLTVNRPSAQDNYGNVTADVNGVSLQSCANGAWTKVAYTFAANAASYNGLEILFDFGNNFSASTQDIQITELDIRVTPGVSIGLNGNPPPLELRPIAAELPFCQRYLLAYVASTAYSNYGTISVQTTTSATLIFMYPTVMRASPTITFSTASNFQLAISNGGIGVTSIGANQITTFSANISIAGSSMTAGNSGSLRDAGGANTFIQFSAEL